MDSPMYITLCALLWAGVLNPTACALAGRSNLVAEGMLPDGVWPQWCVARTARGSA